MPQQPGQVRDLGLRVERAVGVQRGAPVALAQLLDPRPGPLVNRPADRVLHPPAVRRGGVQPVAAHLITHMFGSDAYTLGPSHACPSTSVYGMPEADDLDDSEKNSLIKDGYDKVATEYLQSARSTPASHPRKAKTAALLATLNSNSRVLELGCGAGLPVAEMITDAGHRYKGFDISPRQIEFARALVPAGQFEVGDIAQQDLEPNSFDAALMFYAITHVPRAQWARLLQTVHISLVPGGKFVLNTSQDDSPGWLEENFLGFGGTNWTNGYSADKCVDLLKQTGFEVTEVAALADFEEDPGSEVWVWITATKVVNS